MIAFAGLAVRGERDARTRSICLESDIPCYTRDARHPRPSWVDALASLPRSRQAQEFARLTVREQVEFAVFSLTDAHPPALEWAFEFREHPSSNLGSTIQTMISNESSDRFSVGLVHLVFLAAGPTWRPDSDLVRAMNMRIARIELPLTRDGCRKWMEEIERMVENADAGTAPR